MKFCFVILHYKTLNETYECIKHIKGLNNQSDIQIIVVDNGSKDGSIRELKSNLKEKNNILFVESEYNLGFAKGNNLGYTIAKYKYQAQFIVMLNSDVYIQQNNFTEYVDQIFLETQYDVLGPDIITKAGEHQNPLRQVADNIKKVNKLINYNRLRLVTTFLPFNIKNIIRKKSKGTSNIIESINEERIENCPLHGACLVFSEKFIKVHEYAFYPSTFLYAEEDILYYLGRENNEKFVFSSMVKVLHMEDAATDIDFSNNRKKKRFILKNSNKSLKILKSLMK